MRMMLLGISALGLVGCTTFSSVDESAKNGEGVVQVYSCSKQRALDVAAEVFKDYKAEEVQVRQDSVVAYLWFNLISTGSYCGAFPVEKDGKTELRVISRRKSQIGIFTSLTEETFHEAFAAKLAQSTASK